MLPFAIEAGVPVREYWLLTLYEINASIKGYQQRLQTQATLDYIQADLIAASVGRLLDKKIKYPPKEKAYPALFKEDSRSQKITTEVAKQRLMMFAAHHNEKMRRNGEK